MEVYKFKCWCEKAVSGIIFPPDQKMVYRELMEHMEDHCDALMEQGIDKETAQQMAVEAMGDPWPIAKDLAAIHRPFWGYFLRATRVILILALIVTLIPFCIHAYNTDYGLYTWYSWDMLNRDSYGGDTGRILWHLSEPNISEKSDGYTFTITDAVWWCNEEYDNSCLMLYLKEFHPLPWADHHEAGGWFWAEDSLGNVYECNNEHQNMEETPVLYSTYSQTSPFSYTYALWINSDVPEEAEWVDIRYTRDGRNLVWRIDLTGGDES